MFLIILILSSTVQDGKSSLYIASQEGHTEIVELLLKKGADPNLTRKVCGLVLLLYILYTCYYHFILRIFNRLKYLSSYIFTFYKI